MNQKNRAAECNFYKQQLVENMYPFWGKNGIDNECGGFFTCFANQGTTLLSTDKYTWSQGRMLWVMSTLYKNRLFPQKKLEEIYGLAKGCAEFLMRHCLLPSGNCTFLMTREGTPKAIDGIYDSSIYADCFAIIGLSAFAEISKDNAVLSFAEELYKSVLARYHSGNYLTEPYHVPKGWRAHGVPMILVNTSRNLSDCQKSLSKQDFEVTAQNAYDFACDIVDNFADERNIIHEFIPLSGGFRQDLLLGSYRNPGHTIEDSWFLLTEFTKRNDNARLQKTMKILESALNAGWDSEYGGILLFADCDGGEPKGSVLGYETDPMVKKVQNDWGSKLWWPHSEALYSTLFADSILPSEVMLSWYEKVKAYTFSTFPDKENGEWVQIRDRQGLPENRLVALPVKDPFHIMRNFLLIIELLEQSFE